MSNKSNEADTKLESADSNMANTEATNAEKLPVVTTDVKQKPDLAKRLTKITLILAALYLLWYVVGDRLTPISDQARVRAFVIPIVPQVSGQIEQIYVGGDRRVKKGEVLFEIDSRDYQFKYDQAKAQLEIAGQDVGASTASVASAKARLDKAQADLVSKNINAARIFAMEEQGIVSSAQADRTRGVITQAELEVINAEAAFDEAKQRLGKTGATNPKVLSALADLSTAQLNLERTVVKAPSDGVISYAKVNVGYYASKGQKVMTFISKQFVWIEASYRENSLGNLKQGDPVDIVLDSAPGQVFTGTVRTIGFGVSFDKNEPGALSKPEAPKGWMRDPQRFTVIIAFDDNSLITSGLLREGGQADVIAYTGESFIFKAIGKAWVWFTSYLSYLY
ncbi:HlyD family secretion protein [Thalassotalea crassostreae]|uniref:HlyD family secretion protein n=1 Tax=Thalassotalea crassostreae TaxID=1763536 RepID=UPI0009EEDED5|nr:HlyD family secretion protein [Thalassotalea crassostreae]